MQHKPDLLGDIIATIIVAPVMLLGAAYLVLNIALMAQLESFNLSPPPSDIPVHKILKTLQ